MRQRDGQSEEQCMPRSAARANQIRPDDRFAMTGRERMQRAHTGQYERGMRFAHIQWAR